MAGANNGGCFMFANAYEIATRFTHPVLIFLRFFDGTVEVSPASFVILNRDGWMVTAAHVLDVAFTGPQHLQQIAAYEEKVQAIQQNPKLKAAEKTRRIKQLPYDPKWITHWNYWWRGLGEVEEFTMRKANDLFVARLKSFDATRVTGYPIIKNPAVLRFGTSLCKLGYPFSLLQATFDAATNNFDLPENNRSLPVFPIEGIFTRSITAAPPEPNQPLVQYIETSTPGLKGQSGGPIFDTQGRLWGIQSHTKHFDLGFSPEIERNGRKITEHQFLNAGWGIHPQVLVDMLRELGVELTMSED
jgi:hypothetical protein